MPNLGEALGGAGVYVKRDDCTDLAFGGNKVRQLEFYLGEARLQGADTILITGAVQSNFVRLAAAAARKSGMDCHIQLEERVPRDDPLYRNSGNVLLDRILGATLYSYPEGEDEEGADRRVAEIAEELKGEGRCPYIIPLGPGNPPLGALGYVVAAEELLEQIASRKLSIDEVVVPSGSGHTHGGLLFGLRALGSRVRVTGVCVRRNAGPQRERIRDRCREIAEMLETANPVGDEDIRGDRRLPGAGVRAVEPAHAGSDSDGRRYGGSDPGSGLHGEDHGGSDPPGPEQRSGALVPADAHWWDAGDFRLRLGTDRRIGVSMLQVVGANRCFHPVSLVRDLSGPKGTGLGGAFFRRR